MAGLQREGALDVAHRILVPVHEVVDGRPLVPGFRELRRGEDQLGEAFGRVAEPVRGHGRDAPRHDRVQRRIAPLPARSSRWRLRSGGPAPGPAPRRGRRTVRGGAGPADRGQPRRSGERHGQQHRGEYTRGTRPGSPPRPSNSRLSINSVPPPDCCINRKIRYCPDQSGSPGGAGPPHRLPAGPPCPPRCPRGSVPAGGRRDRGGCRRPRSPLRLIAWSRALPRSVRMDGHRIVEVAACAPPSAPRPRSPASSRRRPPRSRGSRRPARPRPR